MVDMPSREDAIREHRSAGGQVAAVLPIHAPRGLLRAFGILPVELWGPPSTGTAVGDAHLQSYTCSVVRCAFGFLTGPGGEAVDLVLVPHACDSLQGLGTLLLDLTPPGVPVLPFYLPRSPGAPARRFLEEELRSLYARLSEITGVEPDTEALLAAEKREEQADAVLARLLEQPRTLPLSTRAFYGHVRAREYLPAEAFTAHAHALLQSVGDRLRPGVPLILSGLVPEPRGLLDIFDEAGAVLAGDDLACSGRRLYPPGTSDEPFARMAERLLAAPPCFTRGAGLHARLAWLTDMAACTGAVGVLMYGLRCCEPEQFQVPRLREMLAVRGMKSLAVESDIHTPLPHGLATRIEAFLEVLS